MTALHRYTLRVTLSAPFLTQSSSAARFGLDAAVARDHKGRPVLPRTLVTGHLSHAWRAWTDMGIPSAQTCLDWLGKGSDDESGSYEPTRKSLFIDDLVGPDGSGDGTSQRIRIDSERGAVDKGALKIAEQPWAPGTDLIFSGDVRFYGNAKSANSLPQAMRAALEWAGQLGAERGVGFGRIKEVHIAPANSAGVVPDAVRPTSKGLELPLALAFEHPFCFAERNLDNNLFAGSEIVPGAALKGALADAWARLLGKATGTPVGPGFDPARPALSAGYTQLLFTHAIPGSVDGPAAVPPQSLVKTDKGAFRDVALLDDLPLYDGKAPAFAVDWKGKDYGTVYRHFGWPALERDLRVRTAIDLARGRAEDEKLFAYESVVPNDTTRWHCAIRGNGLADANQAQAMQELTSLLEALGWELGPLGKTKVFARLQAGKATDTTAQSRGHGHWIVTLQTPALLGDWRKLDETSGEAAMTQLYRDYFQEASGGTLTLVRHFTRQRLAGGRYLHGRFRGKDAAYRPWLLTEAGSVFVLETASDKARAKVQEWLRTHLPAPTWLLDDAGNEPWRAIPYLPEGGYGQIAVNLPCHEGEPLPLDQ